MKVYVLSAHRWGSLEGHSYVCGVFDNKKDAELAGKHEMLWRGGKYDCMITTTELNEANVGKKDVLEVEWIKYEHSEELQRLNEEYVKDFSHTF